VTSRSGPRRPCTGLRCTSRSSPVLRSREAEFPVSVSLRWLATHRKLPAAIGLGSSSSGSRRRRDRRRNVRRSTSRRPATSAPSKAARAGSVGIDMRITAVRALGVHSGRCTRGSTPRRLPPVEARATIPSSSTPQSSSAAAGRTSASVSSSSTASGRGAPSASGNSVASPSRPAGRSPPRGSPAAAPDAARRSPRGERASARARRGKRSGRGRPGNRGRTPRPSPAADAAAVSTSGRCSRGRRPRA
jgi:hypothetical protein